MAKFCSKCGNKINSDSTRFCSKCGAQLNSFVENNPTIRCPRCNSPVSAESLICVNCGCSLNQEEEQNYALVIFIGYFISVIQFIVLGLRPLGFNKLEYPFGMCAVLAIMGILLGIFLSTKHDETVKKHSIIMMVWYVLSLPILLFLSDLWYLDIVGIIALIIAVLIFLVLMVLLAREYKKDETIFDI